jgi:hypothetical protein
MNTSDDQTQIWKDAIKEAIDTAEKEKTFDGLLSYSEASNAFPNGPHERMPDLNKLDFEAFKLWVNQLGWDAQYAPENTASGNEFAPEIRLTKIGYAPEE